MANNICNRIVIQTRNDEEKFDLIEFLNFTITKETNDGEVTEEIPFCLNNIVPMPEALEKTDTFSEKTMTGVAIQALKDNSKATLKYLDSLIDQKARELKFRRKRSELIKEREEAKKNIRLIKKWGFASWRDWRLMNWGTRAEPIECNCIDYFNSSVCYKFITLNSAPVEAIHALTKKFPNIELDAIFADLDDWGGGCGHIQYDPKSGFKLDRFELESNDAMEILFRLDEYAVNFYQLEDGRWVYHNPFEKEEI